MKKFLTLIFAIIFLLFSMTGCSEIEIVELNERLIIEAIGIDYSNGEYLVTVEGLDSFTAGSDSNSISGDKLTKCYLFKGETVGMAMNSISVITGQIPLFSQARILIIGRQTAEKKLSEVLDFFRREYTTRTDIPIAVAENTAADIITADYGKNVSAGNLIEASIKSFKHTGLSSYTPLYKFFNALMSEKDSASCPIVGIKNNDYENTQEVTLPGTAVFQKDGTIFSLSPIDTQATLIINNNLKNGDLTTNTEKGTFTLEIIDSKTKIKTQIVDGKINFHIDVDLRCDIPEFQSDSFSGLTKNDTETVASAASQKIAKMLSDCINNTVYSKNSDIFNLCRRVNLKNSNYYNSFLKNTDKYGELITFEISVTVSVRRIGKVILKKD